MKHLLSTILIVIAAAVWLGLGYLFYMVAVDTNGLEVRESSAWNMDGVPQSVFKAGDSFLAHRVICASKSSPGEFSVEIVGGPNNVVVPVSRGRTGQVGAGCVARNILTKIPEFLGPGRYTLKAYAVYEVNAFRDIRYELPPIPFEVTR